MLCSSNTICIFLKIHVDEKVYKNMCNIVNH